LFAISGPPPLPTLPLAAAGVLVDGLDGIRTLSIIILTLNMSVGYLTKSSSVVAKDAARDTAAEEDGWYLAADADEGTTPITIDLLLLYAAYAAERDAAPIE